MPSASQIRVLIGVADPQMRERATSALEAYHLLLDTDLATTQSSEAWHVLVTDQVVDGRLVRDRAGQGSFAVVGLGIAENVDVELVDGFTGRELRLAVQLVGEIVELRDERNALAEAHAAVRELAETDPLTGLPNRRAWERRVPALLTRAQHTGRPAWLALVDLDGFKQINDQRGMSHGDQVLNQIAQSLTAALRQDDLVARLGGDEFGILLIGVDESRVLDIFERLRGSIAAGGAVTTSIGLTRADARVSRTELLNAAEIAMRAAKQAGGDRVVRSNFKASSNDAFHQ